MTTAIATPEQRRAALSEFIARIVSELAPLHREHNLAMWDANVTGDEARQAESERLDNRIRRLFSEAEPYRLLCGIRDAGGVDDPLLARQLTLLIQSYQAHQIPPAAIEKMVKLEKALESRLNTFRAEFAGERVADNRLREVLRSSNDPAERRRAWEAMKQVGGEVVADLLTLVRLRNESARAIGFPNYYSMMLTLDELDERELFDTLDQIERGTRPLFQTYKKGLDAKLAERFGIAPAQLRPWHYGDPFFQEAPPAEVDLDPWFANGDLEAIARRFFSEVGFDLGDLLARADLHEKPGKSQHAFCLSVDRGDDIRVLCNLRPNEYWMSTMLHEFGHAVYDQWVDRQLPWLLRGPAHTLTTEASAMLFGRLSKNAAWLTRYAGMPAEEAARAAEAIARSIRSQLLVQVRWNLVMCHMERELYRDPGRDLDTLWWDLVERYQWLVRPEGRRAPDWASKIHFSVAPVYYQNYLLGEMMATQLQRHVLKRVLGDGNGAWARYVSSPEVGAFLKRDLYACGRRYDWRETLKRATGEPLSVAAIVDELAGRG